MADYVQATGRRKCSVARVRLFPTGDGTIKVNDRDWEEYFNTDNQRAHVSEPLRLVEKFKGVNIQANLDGGGVSGQAGALRHGIARALIKMDPSLRPALKKEGMLTRDPRMVERKKYGQPGARKRFQFSKR